MRVWDLDLEAMPVHPIDRRLVNAMLTRSRSEAALVSEVREREMRERMILR